MAYKASGSFNIQRAGEVLRCITHCNCPHIQRSNDYESRRIALKVEKEETAPLSTLSLPALTDGVSREI